MEKHEVEKCPTNDEAGHLNRNRSFKTKQLVRSQAIRESASPPRTASPPARECERDSKLNAKGTGDCADDAGGCGDERRQPVEIQITAGAWQAEGAAAGAGAGRRAAGDLLTHSPRVACVCGACAPCPQCRGRRRRHLGINKQDSGIGVDECADCETNGGAGTGEARAAEYCRCPERRERHKHSFTRTDSEEPSGAELVAFLSETLNKNAKDRAALLRIERELHALVNDSGRCIVKFPVMTSYGRMLVHRCAALFQLSHHPDQFNKYCVIVSKAGTSGGRIPCTSFKSWCVTQFPPASPARAPDPAPLPHQAKSILKRACGGAAGRGGGALAARSKSLEQREQDYERARRRIFSQDDGSPPSPPAPWAWLGAGPVKVLTPEHARNKLLKVQSLETPPAPAPGGGRARGGAVAKSHSFGGYTDPPAAPARALSRQGDLASSSWRLSPSSSGYKTLSLRSTDSATPSPTGGGTPEPAAPGGGGGGGPAVPAPAAGGAVVWAVTDMARVPPGVTVIHPQTGRPLTNPDGSLYRFDPDNPPHVYAAAAAATHHHQPAASSDTRRGRLEKQHSFIDHEAECAATEPCEYACAAPSAHAAQDKQESAPAACPAGAGAEPPAPHLYQGTVYYSPQLYTPTHAHYDEQLQSPPPPPPPPRPCALGADATPLLEHNLRNLVVSGNMGYGGGHYVQHVPCRIEAVAPLYGAATPALDEHKVPSPPGTTFRIDASYPYPQLEYNSYVDAPAAPALAPAGPVGPLHQRSYSVGYGGELSPAAPCPAGGVYGVPWALPYGAPMLSGPPARPTHASLLYPHHYNTLLYPQMVPQYGVCAPVFAPPAAGHARSPPAPAPTAPTAPRAVRNNGHGLLGRYPQQTGGELQLSGAARALLRSVRHLHDNNAASQGTPNNNQDRRYDYRDRHDRTDRRTEGQTDRQTHKHSYTYDRYNYQKDRNNYTQLDSNQENVTHGQDKSNIQDRNSNAPDRNHVHERSSYDRNSNVQDRSQDRSNVQDRTVQDRTVQDRTGQDRIVQDKNTYQERSYRRYQQTETSPDSALNSAESNAQDVYQETYYKAEIFTENTKENVQIQSIAQESTDKVYEKSRGTSESAGGGVSPAQAGGGARERGGERHRYQDRSSSRGGFPPRGGRHAPHAAPRPHLQHYRPHYLFRQMSAGAWCRRPPAPLQTGVTPAAAALPRRAHPDTRSGRRY